MNETFSKVMTRISLGSPGMSREIAVSQSRLENYTGGSNEDAEGPRVMRQPMGDDGARDLGFRLGPIEPHNAQVLAQFMHDRFRSVPRHFAIPMP